MKKLLSITYVDRQLRNFLIRNDIPFTTPKAGEFLQVTEVEIMKGKNGSVGLVHKRTKVVELPTFAAYYTNVLTTRAGLRKAVRRNPMCIEIVAKKIAARNGLKRRRL